MAFWLRYLRQARTTFTIKDEAGKIVLIPAIPDVIRMTDVDSQRMEITPLKGLFDDED